MTPAELYRELIKIDELTWCHYLLNQDPLHDRISTEKGAELIEGAIACGERLAVSVNEDNKFKDARQLANAVCEISHTDVQDIAHQVFLANFTEPNEIKLFDTPITRLADLNLAGFSRDVILEIVLGHELFHYAESKHKDLFTQTAKIELWQFFGYHHLSQIRAVSEIAAMIFSWRLNKLAFSPLVLNVLLLDIYSKDRAVPTLHELQALQSKLQAQAV